MGRRPLLRFFFLPQRGGGNGRSSLLLFSIQCLLDFHYIESTGHWKDFPFSEPPSPPTPNQYSVPHGDEVLTYIYQSHLLLRRPCKADPVRQARLIALSTGHAPDIVHHFILRCDGNCTLVLFC